MKVKFQVRNSEESERFLKHLDSVKDMGTLREVKNWIAEIIIEGAEMVEHENMLASEITTLVLIICGEGVRQIDKIMGTKEKQYTMEELLERLKLLYKV